MSDLFNLTTPKGWKSVPMWTIATRKDRKGYPEAELLSVYREFGVIRKSDRDDNHNVESDDLSSYKFVKRGDLVLNKMKTWQGSLGVSPSDGIVSPAYFTCELSANVHGPFIHHLLRSRPYIAMYGAVSKGIRVGQWDLPYEEFRRLPVLLPPIEDQQKIALFLERECERISLIIDRKLEIIQLLEENLQNSIGEILESTRKRIKLKYRFSAASGNSISSEFIAENNLMNATGLPFIATKEVDNNGSINYDTEIQIPTELLDGFRIAKPGTLFLCSEGGSAGKKFGLNTEKVAYGNKLFALTSKGQMSEKVLFYVFLTRNFQDQFRLGMNGMIGGVGSSVLGEILIPDVSAEDEYDLLIKLESIYRLNMERIGKIETSIKLFNEYKTSLITSAVMGQFHFNAKGIID